MEKPTPPPPPTPPEAEIKSGWNQLWSGTKKFFGGLLDLRSGLDREGTIVNIRKNMRMQGANSWMLMCSIVIASIGLDQNSQAVIIGAMLISPLMSPILGIGLSVGINDFSSLRISVQHFGISIGIALFTSTLYFLMTPFGGVTDQIISRTSPTLLDAAIALFGGVAGIVSGSQKDKSNAIPGVAIATALMPPLCVTGFGLANLDAEIVFNSFYLFFLNATLVALATFVIVRLMNFPHRTFANTLEKSKTNALILLFSVIMIIPSFHILRKVLRAANVNNTVKTAIDDCFGANISTIDDWKVELTDSTSTLLIRAYGTANSKELIQYKKDLSNKLEDFQVQIITTNEVPLSSFQALQKDFTKVGELDSLVQSMLTKDVEKESEQVLALRRQLSALARDTSLENSINTEILEVYNDYFSNCYYVHPIAGDTIGLVILNWKKPVSTAIKGRVEKIVKSRSKIKKLVIANQ